tara:strand:- start:5206 stop:5643 length:438 start_codon:yes stop_codon:yes gene_type:complete
MTRALQNMIHVGCRELRIDSDARRALQLEVCGKTSMSDMTEADLKKVIKRLKKDGFNAQPGANKRAASPRADLRYVHVLWGLLGKAGKLKKPGRDGLNAFVRSRFEHKWQSVPLDIDNLRNGGQINDVTRALKDWCEREHIKTEL